MSKTAKALGFDHIVTVTLDRGIKKPLDYGTLKTSGNLEIGSRVLVPVRNGSKEATVICVKNSSSTPGIRPIIKVLFDRPLLSSKLFELAQWMSKYYTTPLSKVISTMLPKSATKSGGEKQLTFIKPAMSLSKLKTLAANLRASHPSRSKVLDVLLKCPQGLFETELIKKAKVSTSPIKTLAKEKALTISKQQVLRSPLEDVPFFQTKEKTLTQEQQKAFDAIASDLKTESPSCHLLFGVTGSGKTEVYLQLIKKVRDEGKGVLLLVPEIALTSQTIERIKTRFLEPIGVLHHKLSGGEKYDMWHQIEQGKIKIVIGARSAVFAPIKNLGLIIVDEEGEPSFKQTDEMPCYNGRDIAVLRGKLENAGVILGSATPSLESYYNATIGRYKLHTLEKRASSASMPIIELIDKSSPLERPGPDPTLFSNTLVKEIKQRVEKGEQIILFLNRRGYNTCMLCTSCNTSITCPSCDLPLTFHKKIDTLKCHTCDYQIHPVPKKCPSCHQQDPITFKGVGTEKVERLLHKIVPGIRTLRFDRESTQNKGSHEAIYQQFLSGKADVLIGTQMVAKGLHFPKVTLVGVMNTDGALNIPDFRSSEKCFSLITQVAGRAGRSDLEGLVLIQTYLKDNPTLKQIQSGSYTQFYSEEISLREMFNYPPFCRMTKIVGKSKHEAKLTDEMHAIYTYLKKVLPETTLITAPCPCGHAKIKDYHRHQILIKRPSQGFFPSEIATSIMAKTSTHFSVMIDHDPQSIFF